MSKYSPIADYGLVGNLHTAALICKRGSIDFLSYPRFDSPTVFTKLLDAERGGAWSITPVGVEDFHTEQYYEPETAILVTRLMHRDGILEITDFMPPVEDIKHCQVVRMVRALVGTTDLTFDLEARYPYAAEPTEASADADGGGLSIPLGPHSTTLLGLRGEERHDCGARITFGFRLSTDGAGVPRSRVFVFQSRDCNTPAEDGVEGFGESLLAYTRTFWKEWVAKIHYEGSYRPTIIRSAVTLKLCTSAEYGSSVAAPTFGLPEEIGGERNWDYRYSWIRDSAFTMYAMIRLGLKEEAQHFMSWIEARCSELDDASELALMYRVDGTTDLDEYEVALEGYRGSSPVRVGNGAKGQRQLDIYGELIDTVYLYDTKAHEITYAFWLEVCEIIEFVCKSWREADHGIWEVRSGQQQFTMSKVMAWVAIDRGIRIAQHRGFPAPYDRWFEERDAIYQSIYDVHFDEELKSWTQYPDSKELDGSLLMMPLIRFVAPQEPNWLATLAQIEKHLVDDCLVKRYEPKEGTADGLKGDEGYFSICSAWYIEVLAKVGRLDEAERLLTKFLSYANHLGLYSEEIAINGEQLGNFPQAFTHLGLISAILQVDEQRKGSGRV